MARTARHVATFAALLLASLAAAYAAPGERIRLYLDPAAAQPEQNAIAVLRRSLQHRNITVDTPTAPAQADLAFVRQPGGAPESFEIRASTAPITASAPDSVGLMYAIFELLGQIESSPASAPFRQAITPITRTPATRIRGMSLFPQNRELERDWFYSRDYWTAYFELLARSRFNYFTLTFGDQSAYFGPPFPFLLEVPGYERVKTSLFTPAERQRNLEAVKMISELSEQWGVRFILGIWLENPDKYGPKLVDGLSYQDLFDYCPKALDILLRACPKITGISLRVNSESGIEEDDQLKFFVPMVKVAQSSGRPMWINVRAKGLRTETVTAARELGAKFTVSTKYWREHMGLPYHGLRIDAFDKFRSYRRYGYWDLLPHDRPYDVLYQLWTYGSQKLLLWGGLDYANRFAVSSRLGDATGFEVFAPLSHKGYLNRGGNWPIFARKDDEYFRWEFERYWAFYLSFGLAGYAPNTPQPVYEAEFRKRFGDSARAVRRAYETASYIIPFITAARAGSASNFTYWPEFDSLGLTDHQIALGTGDDDRFYTIERYVEDYLSGTVSARLTPSAIANRLDSMGNSATHALPTPSQASKELASTRTDFTVLSELARYHAARVRSATSFQFFRKSGERFHLLEAIAQYREALTHWEKLSAAGNIYYDRIIFNRPPDQVGHWRDELPLLRHELTRLQAIDTLYTRLAENPSQAATLKPPAPTYSLNMRWREDPQTRAVTRWPDDKPVPSPPGSDRYQVEYPETVVTRILKAKTYSRILHVPLRSTSAASPAQVHASILGSRDGLRLQLWYRFAGQGFRFQSAEMQQLEPNIYVAQLPAAKPGHTLYYFLRATYSDTEFLDGSAKEPHRFVYASASAPVVIHKETTQSNAGADLPIQTRVNAQAPIAAVRLHYRHLDQSEDWRILDMQPDSTGVYRATIPGEFVVPGWDLMYAIEVIDISGSGAFYPNLDVRDPFVVVKVIDPLTPAANLR